jgi:hypothetical protein
MGPYEDHGNGNRKSRDCDSLSVRMSRDHHVDAASIVITMGGIKLSDL